MYDPAAMFFGDITLVFSKALLVIVDVLWNSVLMRSAASCGYNDAFPPILAQLLKVAVKIVLLSDVI